MNELKQLNEAAGSVRENAVSVMKVKDELVKLRASMAERKGQGGDMVMNYNDASQMVTVLAELLAYTSDDLNKNIDHLQDIAIDLEEQGGTYEYTIIRRRLFEGEGVY